MKIIESGKEKIIFIEDMPETLANAIRRSVQEIPVLAIDEVTFYKNDSALYDEIIAHRLGLVPLNNEKLNLPEECSCKQKGCAKCSVELKIKSVGPKTVYSGDLKGKADVIYEKMPIVILNKEQELELVATAKMGKGIQHAKFSPGLAYYRNFPEFKVSKDCDKCSECVKKCPKNLLSLGKEITIKDIHECDMCEACVEVCNKHGKKAISISPTSEIVFFIESFGMMPAKDILVEAVKALNSNLDELGKIK